LGVNLKDVGFNRTVEIREETRMRRVRKLRRGGRVLLMVMALLLGAPCRAQSGEQWYQNPQNFGPSFLRGRNALFTVAGAVGLSLWLTDRPKDRSDRTFDSYETGFFSGYKSPAPDTNVIALGIGRGYRVRDWLSLGGEAVVYAPFDGDKDTLGVGIRPFTRWRLARSGRTQVQFEYGAGLMYFAETFPNGGSQFNFNPFYGLALETPLRKKRALRVGIRHVHVSNGYVYGPDRNPAYDANGIFLGITRTIR
jgi:hypothetical protein